MRYVWKIVAFVIGVAFGLASAVALSPALAAFTGEGSGPAMAAFAVVVGSGLLAAFAPTMRRAFGRGFLLLGACLWALPLSAFLLSGRAASEVVSASAEADQAMAAVGAGLAGAAFTGLAAFVGLILGSICLVTGLILALGGRREVVVREARWGARN